MKEELGLVRGEGEGYVQNTMYEVFKELINFLKFHGKHIKKLAFLTWAQNFTFYFLHKLKSINFE